MYRIREVLYRRPGKVGEMVKKIQATAPVMERMGYPPFRVLTDVTGEQFWTAVLESDFETLDGFQAMQAAVMADPEAREAMAGYHDLVVKGRREIYKVEG
jgi:hypothetical protein